MRYGWQLQPFFIKKDEIGLEDGCLFMGIHVIIPTIIQSRILQSLHPGICRMKAIAHSYFWWFGLDNNIEWQAISCLACQAIKPTSQLAPLYPWVWPEDPWKRVHIDFAGLFVGKMFFVVVDAHSKWPVVIAVPSLHLNMSSRDYFVIMISQSK